MPARAADAPANLVRQAVGQADLEVEILSVLEWTAAAQVAERMQLGRVFLAGDAAHNLAWKLAHVLAGGARQAGPPSTRAHREVAATVRN